VILLWHNSTLAIVLSLWIILLSPILLSFYCYHLILIILFIQNLFISLLHVVLMAYLLFYYK